MFVNIDELIEAVRPIRSLSPERSSYDKSLTKRVRMLG
jgi:hypothetical protein